VTEFAQLVSLRSEWLSLETDAGAELPFQTWEWAIAWWTHLAEHSRGVWDHLRVCVLRDEAERVVAIAPLVLTERPAYGPLRVRFLQLMGADPNITEIRTVLCRPGLEQQCWETLRAYFKEHSAEWDWLAWERSTRPPGVHELQSNGACSADIRSAFILNLSSDWPTMKGQLGRNIKESLRKCYNSLRRDGLSASLEMVQEPDAIEAALADFFRLHAQRAMLKGAPRHADVFASEEARAFLIDVCQRLATRGIARVFRLRVNGEVVAVRIGFEMQGCLYLYYSGWDAAFGRYSVMTTLLAEIIQHAISRGLVRVNLSTGNDVSKTRWRPTEVAYARQVEVSPRLTSAIRFHGYQAARSLGAGRLAREFIPSSLVRRSEPRRHLAELRHLPREMPTRLHTLAGTATAIAVVDLLDNSLDHRWLMMAHDASQFLR
jgi:CelD/BcsL family acetyltransferase involved in cellulose biosynthesis